MSLVTLAATTAAKQMKATKRGFSSSFVSASTCGNEQKTHYDAFMQFILSNKASFDGVCVRPSADHCRGLVATRTFREGTTVLSVPMHALAINAERLLASEHIRSLNPPKYDDVRCLLTARSIKDPVLCEQVHLALLVAGERLNPNSFFAPYFNLMPCPAINDEAVMLLHKDVLDPLQLLEWDDHQREWVTVFRTLARRWGPQGPPVEVCYWAWRLVLSRMHMLPDRGLAPAVRGSTLNYFALSTFARAERQAKLMKRVKAMFGAAFGNDYAAEEYRLVPTLLPLLDMAGHLSCGNVSVEVHPRPAVGSCAELQAVREIQAGEEIGLCFNRSHSPAFTLYRFGFLPV